MKRHVISGVLAGVLSVGMAVTTIPAVNVLADDMGWVEEDGIKYWYENGVKQGTEGRGKEIYDPVSDAWYWLDAVDGGKMAVSKDVYQESGAGEWGDYEVDGVKMGKWVRYDENGHMVKGWDEQNGNRYYFDPTYGTMAKGDAVIDGVYYYFNRDTGILERSGAQDDDGNDLFIDGWHNVDGGRYWYENGMRQGYRTNADGSIDLSYRGKEVYDPGSDAWYWLDNVLNGGVAKDKDVYQESQADDAGNIGKWVRYDSEGHMVKGWNEKDGNRYFFDYVYGTMAKGYKNIDGRIYEFDKNTGIMLREMSEQVTYNWNCVSEKVYTMSGQLSMESVAEYNDDGNIVKTVKRVGRKYNNYTGMNYAADDNDTCIEDETEYKYDGAYNLIQKIHDSYTYDSSIQDSRKDYHEVEKYNPVSGKRTEDSYTYYKSNGDVDYYTEYKYNDSGRLTEYYKYNADGSMNCHKIYDYNDRGLRARDTEYGSDGQLRQVKTYEYNENGKCTKVETSDASGRLVSAIERTYDNNNLLAEKLFNANRNLIQYTEYSYDGTKVTERNSYNVAGENYNKTSRTVYEYDGEGSLLKEVSYRYKAFGQEYIDSRMTYTYEDCTTGAFTYHLLKTRDCELGRWDNYRQDYVLGYSYGDVYNYQNGTTNLIGYVRHKNNNTTTDYFECYDYIMMNFPSGEPGATYSAKCERKFDSGNQQVSYTEKTYEYVGKKYLK